MTLTDGLGDTAPRVRVIVESGDSGFRNLVDLTDGPESNRSSDHTTRVVGGLALLIAFVFVLLVVADGQRADVPTAADAITPSTTGLPIAPSVPTSSIDVLPSVGNRQLVPWPTPPDDHEPRIMSWPAAPIGADLAIGTIVYVNTIGRPTILDLAGGFQSEVDVSPVRISDSFLLEDGRVVTDVSGRSLPKATDAAIEIRVQHGGEGTTDSEPGTILSVHPSAARLVDGIGLEALTTLFGSSDLDEERWTTFFVGETGEETFRLPTPDPTTNVWIIES